jgi:tRNA pseudouridine38-40 synthase
VPRYKLTIEYDGAPFCGWQIQADQVTVQGVLTAAVTALTGDTVLVQGAGRTDAGVSAVKRHYLYRIINRRADLALDAGHAWRVPRPLDAAAMHDAAQRLVGKHDFTTFRSTECQAKSPVKTLDQFDVERHGDHVYVIASARSFLHNQVRSMVGSLVAVGDGKWSADDLSRALQARDRTACGQVAPPDGLYLMKVDY